MIRFRGHWNGKAIIPDEPITIASDKQLRVTVEEDGETVWQRIALLGKEMPGDLPRDLASQHDHYVHGRPKR